MQTTYRTGNWYVLVAPGALIALSPDAPDELVARLWDRQHTGGDLAAVIDALTEHSSGSFAAMLPFAAVVLEGADARIAVRGDVTVELTGPDGSESFTGTNVTTWSERFAQNTIRIAVSAGDADNALPLPITGGIVRAAHVSAEVEPADVTAPDAALVEGTVEESVAEPVVDSAKLPVVAESAEDVVEEAAQEPAFQEPAFQEPAEKPIEEPAEEPAEMPAAEASVAEPVESPAVEPAPDDAVEGATLVPSDLIESSDTESSETDVFDQLFGATIASPNSIVQPAPVPPAPTAPFGVAPPAGPADGDHDGATISVAEARALRHEVPTAEPDAPTAVLPVVAAGSGRVRVSTGQVVTLDRTVIIGRRPRSTRASGADLPHLIAVESPKQDISRSHLEIRPEGDTVVVVDLHTTNGSTLLRPGADPLRLHPGEQTLVLSGDVVDLGDGVTVTFEDLP